MPPDPVGFEFARRRLAADPAQPYWLHAPPSAIARGAGAPIVVSVHGISRNAGAHLRALAPVAEQFGCVLVAPHFSCDRFPDYQRFGRPERFGKGGRADVMLLRIVDEVRDLLALHDASVGFFGHSGGAQFVQRFVLAHGPARHVLSAAGSYAWPAGGQPFPLGCAPSSRFADLTPRVDNLLQSSALVLVGDADDLRDASLRQGTRIDAEQGPTRMERARRYVDSLAALASEHGLAAPARLELLPHCKHAFSDVVKRGDLAARAMRHLLAPEGWIDLTSTAARRLTSHEHRVSQDRHEPGRGRDPRVRLVALPATGPDPGRWEQDGKRPRKLILVDPVVALGAFKREATRYLIDKLGPTADGLAIRLERARNLPEVRPLLAGAALTLRSAGQNALAEEFVARFIAPLQVRAIDAAFMSGSPSPQS